MKFQALILGALLAFTATAFAAPIPIGATTSSPESAAFPHSGGHMGPCQKEPSTCQANAAKFDQWCEANADKCTALKAWAEKRIAYCEANAQKCAEHKQKMEARHAQICQQDPSAPHCHAIRANVQPGDEDQTDDQQPPPPPSA
jgi:hypothetical protein